MAALVAAFVVGVICAGSGSSSPASVSTTPIYASALAWVAVEEDIVLLVPSTASGLAWARLYEDAHPVLEVRGGFGAVSGPDQRPGHRDLLAAAVIAAIFALALAV